MALADYVAEVHGKICVAIILVHNARRQLVIDGVHAKFKTQQCAASLLQRNITSWRRGASEEARPGPRVTVQLLMSSRNATHLLGPGPHLPPLALEAPLPLLLPLPPHLCKGGGFIVRKLQRGNVP